MSIGEKIREARKKKGLTQKELADMIGAKHTSISGWEKDQHRPDVDSIELLCGALDVPISYIIEIDNNVLERAQDRLSKTADIFGKQFFPTEFEKEMLLMFRQLSLDEKNMIYDLIQTTLNRKKEETSAS